MSPNWKLIESSTQQREVALMAAEQRRIIATKADYCVRWLKVQGFEVVRVEQGAVGPRIIIRHSPLCKQLDGTVSAYERSKKAEQRYSFAFRFDCEVRWMDHVEAHPSTITGWFKQLLPGRKAAL